VPGLALWLIKIFVSLQQDGPADVILFPRLTQSRGRWLQLHSNSMKHLAIGFFILLALSWKFSENNYTSQVDNNKKQVSSNLKDNFRNFRNALYQNNKIKIKQFIDFPILNDNNEIWYLVYEDVEKVPLLISGNIKPFSEKDFDKYYTKVFSKMFITSILNIKSDVLFKSGYSETREFKEDNTTYKMYATYDKAKSLLELNLAMNTIIKNSDGTIDPGESNIVYYFSISKNGEIKFKYIRLAG